MYLNASTDKIEILLENNVTTNQLQWNVSWQDITSSGMTLPQNGGAGNTSNTSSVDIVAAPSAATTRQITNINIFNNDTVVSRVIVRKDISGTKYILTKALLQVSDTLHWSRESGWVILKQSLQESIVLTEFTSNGTWTKPSGLKRVLVCCVGAGGGGGSGRRGATSTNRQGGGGGGGGAIVWNNIEASSLPSSVSVTIGAGGTGGTGITVDDTNGNTGTNGGDTSFGGFVLAKGGTGGNPGLNSTSMSSSLGGAASACIPSYGPFAITGATNGTGSTSNSGNAISGLSGSGGAPGGSGGSGITNANALSTSAGSGGGVYNLGVFISGASAANSGVNNAGKYLMLSTSIACTNGVGTGGAGGYGTVLINGGNGGNAGAGAGGGAGTTNGSTSGAGGTGGDGLCVIMEIY